MLIMVIERFHDPAAVYRRLAERGRMLVDGVAYVDSWVEPSRRRCFQLMRCDNLATLRAWAENWEDLVEFEFVEVISSEQAASPKGS
jgi:hypothetical protein